MQLLALHDEVAEPDQPHWKVMKAIVLPTTCPYKKARVPIFRFFKHECPSHDRSIVSCGQPAKHQTDIRLVLEDVEAVGHARKRRKQSANRKILKLWHDLFGASPAAVVNKVVAVPSCSIAGSHLRQPRPDLMTRASNRNCLRK